MKISKLELINFKYFDNLTIELPKDTDVILLVGPNGVGKSCIFEAINNKVRPGKKNNFDNDATFFAKDKEKPYSISLYDNDGIEAKFDYNAGRTIKVYGRTAYRFTNDINRQNISQSAGQSVKSDQNSPNRFTDLDQRIEDDIEAALGIYMTEVQKRGKNTDTIIDSVIDPMNKSLRNILGKNGIQLVTILNPFDEKGSAKIDLLFTKNNTEFIYKNLSAGEKEIFDIIFNFYRRAEYHITDGIYYIDEPELHINTSVQSNLLRELRSLCVKFNAQLWVATHSVGFLREAQKNKNDHVAILELSKRLAKGNQLLRPSTLDWQGWQRILLTPLDDLAFLTLPERIIYCEGNPIKTGFDEKIYSLIFGQKYQNTIFVSSGGRTQPINNSLLAAKVFGKLSSNVELLVLKDRDYENMSKEKRDDWLQKNIGGRMLERLEIENYIFDIDVLRRLNPSITEVEYNKIIKTDVTSVDTKKLKQRFQTLAKDKSENIEVFMEKLAKEIPNTSIYKELERVIFS